jgi:hypothetical protein
MTSNDQDVARLRAMIDELRRIRESCEPKVNTNPRYHALSAAVSQLNRAIVDIEANE